MIKKLFTIIFLFSILFCGGCKNDKKTHISYSTWGSQSEITTIKSLVNEFEKENPQIKVDVIHIPDNYFQKLHLLIASNLAPDVIFINNLNSSVYINAEKFENLNKYIQNSKDFKMSDFIEKAFLPATVNGNIYMIPRDISNMVIYYNEDLFDKYNVPYPKNNWTMEDFINIAKMLTSKQDNVWGFGFEKKSLFWLAFLLSNNGGIIDDKGNVIIQENNSKEALQMYADFRNKYNISPKSAEQSSFTTSQLFMNNKVAMHLCGRWCSLTYKKDKNLRWNIAEFPQGKNGAIVPLDISGWAISSSSLHKNEAWKFIEFMTTNKSMTKLTKDGLIVPSRKNVAYSKTFLDGQPKNAQLFLDVISTSKPTSVCTKYAEINDVLDENLEMLFEGKADANTIIDKKFVKKLEKLTEKK